METVTRGVVVGGGDKADDGLREVEERRDDADEEVLCRPKFELERALSRLVVGDRLPRLVDPDFGTIS